MTHFELGQRKIPSRCYAQAKEEGGAGVEGRERSKSVGAAGTGLCILNTVNLIDEILISLYH